MTNVDLSASGTYFFAVTNIYGAVTSAPFMLNVLVPVQRMLVSAIDISGQPGSVLGLYYSDDLGPATNWQTLTSMTLAGSSQFCFDVTTPLPPYRYYLVEQPAGAGHSQPDLELCSRNHFDGELGQLLEAGLHKPVWSD